MWACLALCPWLPGADDPASNVDPQYPYAYLFSAVRSQDLELTQKWLTSHPTLAQQPIDPNNPLTAFRCLNEACARENVEIAQLLIAHGARGDEMDPYGVAAIHNAAANGNPAFLRLLIDHHALVDLRDKTGATALHYALIAGRLQNAQTLLDHGADPQASTTADRNAVFFATLAPDPLAALRLLEPWQVPVDPTADLRSSPLSACFRNYACKQEHFGATSFGPVDSIDPREWVFNPKVFTYLLDHGANLQAVNPDTGANVLSLAAAVADPETLQRCLDAKLDINQREERSQTSYNPVYFRVDEETRQRLLQSGEPWFLTERQFYSPLDAAIDRQNYDAIPFLVAHGALLTQRYEPATTPMHLLVNENNGPSTSYAKYVMAPIKALRAAGNEPTDEQANLMEAQLTESRIGALLAMLHFYPDFNQLNGQGLSILMYCDFNRFYPASRSTPRFLLEHGTDPNLQGAPGRAPLFAAAQWGDADAVQMLLDFGADPNLHDEKGRTPLEAWLGREIDFTRLNSHPIARGANYQYRKVILLYTAQENGFNRTLLLLLAITLVAALWSLRRMARRTAAATGQMQLHLRAGHPVSSKGTAAAHRRRRHDTLRLLHYIGLQDDWQTRMEGFHRYQSLLDAALRVRLTLLLAAAGGATAVLVFACDPLLVYLEGNNFWPTTIAAAILGAICIGLTWTPWRGLRAVVAILAAAIFTVTAGYGLILAGMAAWYPGLYWLTALLSLALFTLLASACQCIRLVILDTRAARLRRTLMAGPPHPKPDPIEIDAQPGWDSAAPSPAQRAAKH